MHGKRSRGAATSSSTTHVPCIRGGIGVGRTRYGPPSLRTGRADLPHPALRLVVSATRLDEQLVGLEHGEKTQLLKVGIRPSLVIPAASQSPPALTFAQDGSESSPDEPIDTIKVEGAAVFEVLEPASQDHIELLDDRAQTLSVGSECLLVDRILELSQALLARIPFSL